MKSYIPEEKLTALIKSSLILMCKTSLTNTSEIEIKGLLGITLDRKNIILVDVSEVITVGEELKHDYSLDDSDLTELEDNYIPECSVKKKAKVKENLRVRLNNPKRLKKDKASKIVHNNVDILKNSNEGETDYTSMTSDELKVEKDKGSGMENHEVTSNTSSSDVQKRVKSAGEVEVLVLHKEKPFLCGKCTKSFVSKKSLKRHLIGHHGDGWTCAVCERHHTNYESFRKHLWTHASDYPFKCDYCKKGFVTRLSLDRHMALHVDGNSEIFYSCDNCNKKLSSLKSLDFHKKRCLSGKISAKNYSCNLCFKSFAYKQSLVIHDLNVHRGLKYPCSNCNKTFRYPPGLVRHQKICKAQNSAMLTDDNLDKEILIYNSEQGIAENLPSLEIAETDFSHSLPITNANG